MKNFTIGYYVYKTLLLMVIIAQCGIIAKSTRKIRQSTMDNLEDIVNPSTPVTPVQRIFDPHLSWMAFVRNSDRSTNRHRIKSGGGGKKAGTLPMPPGPQGPQGPPGPPGPPGANVTKEVLLTEFREMVREVAEKRIELALGQSEQGGSSTILDNVDVNKSSGPYIPLFDVDSAAILPKVTAGFFSRLVYTVNIAKKSLRELTDFHVPFGDGAFQRGENLKENSSIFHQGRYTAPRSGIYNFNINLHFLQKRKNKPHSRKGTLHALLCIESLCQTNIALESVISNDQLGDRFSLSVSGILELKKGQYVSVIVDNNTHNSIKVQPSSYFSGILAGV